ncbi:hypothetical protein F4805DRAFT_461376 [Annulohypoxylon moriforme]|nr:hypothetical protein F4805DRAFT_461376 [Annulohypoxylon moriforme]
MWEEVRRIVADRLDSVFKEWQSNQSVNMMARSGNSSPNSHRRSIQSTQINTPNSSEGSGTDVGSREMANAVQSLFCPSTNAGASVDGQQTWSDVIQRSSACLQNIDGDALDISNCLDPDGVDFYAWGEDSADQHDDTSILNFDASADCHVNPS